MRERTRERENNRERERTKDRERQRQRGLTLDKRPVFFEMIEQRQYNKVDCLIVIVMAHGAHGINGTGNVSDDS